MQHMLGFEGAPHMLTSNTITLSGY